jgi:glyoxylase-like metal-dependent hydrolase (beta-lactamase superfamily II)
MASKEIPLEWDVFVAKRQGLTRDLPPGKEQLNWVGGSATLIHGTRDAVLVDTLLTIDQNRALADWIAVRSKNLTTIYITHGHGDHFFGLGVLLDRFPGRQSGGEAQCRKSYAPAGILRVARKLLESPVSGANSK